MSKVSVYENKEVIGFVECNNNLDVWNGRNWQSGGSGLHKGITKLNNGKFVLIFSSDWVGDNDYAIVVSDKKAFNEIAKSDIDLLDEFEELKRFIVVEEA